MTALSSISIRSFQSLTHVDLDLAPFTVIVGPSSSGKSAFVRALQTVTRNARGSAFITQGKPACSITATLPTATISLTRSKSSSGSDAYTLDAQRFTKLGGTTPPEIISALGQLADPAAIAAQFDPPYLLTQSPAEAARTLAALTGAHIVLEGAREANRQRLETAATLRTRTQDAQRATEDLACYPHHDAQISALASAEGLLTAAREAQRRIAALQGLLDSIDCRATGVRTLRSGLQALPPLPTDAALDGLASTGERRDRLQNLLRQISTLASNIRGQRSALDAADQQISVLDQQHADTLHALGTCPTCGSTL